jgi:phenylacetate-CoA ligase
MPLVRYRTGDFVKIKKYPQKCPCQRGFPTVISILGRQSDIIFTPDGRALTALYVAFDRTPGLLFGQIVQEKIDRLIIRTCPNSPEINKTLLNNLREFVGNDMEIAIETYPPKEIPRISTGKFKVVVSKIDLKNNNFGSVN